MWPTFKCVAHDVLSKWLTAEADTLSERVVNIANVYSLRLYSLVCIRYSLLLSLQYLARNLFYLLLLKYYHYLLRSASAAQCLAELAASTDRSKLSVS